MSREKQKLECEMAEMLEIIEKAREIYANDITDHTENEYIREGLLDAGFRKQIEAENMAMYPKSAFECSLCGWSNWDLATGDGTYKYCPNCGAKMKGGAE